MREAGISPSLAGPGLKYMCTFRTFIFHLLINLIIGNLFNEIQRNQLL